MSKGLTLLAGRLLEAEQQAALALAKAQQDLKLFMDQQNALNQYRQIYHQQWTDRGLQGITPQQNSQYHAFINKLENAATCVVDPCYENDCSGHGSCDPYFHPGACVCECGYYGADCAQGDGLSACFPGAKLLTPEWEERIE